MEDELGGNIVKEIVGLIAKAYSYFKDKNDEGKKSKWHKKVCHKKCLEVA